MYNQSVGSFRPLHRLNRIHVHSFQNITLEIVTQQTICYIPYFIHNILWGFVLDKVLTCCTMQINGVVRRDCKNHGPCHSGRSTMKIPFCSETAYNVLHVVSTKHRPK